MGRRGADPDGAAKCDKLRVEGGAARHLVGVGRLVVDACGVAFARVVEGLGDGLAGADLILADVQ